jgi:peptidoglycan/xylan/chitin deacetylase (PgdA/CDA1 family)
VLTRALRLLPIIVLLAATPLAGTQASRQVAITIDDLPRGGDGGPRDLRSIRAMTERLLRPLREGRVPVVGFVNQIHESTVGADGLRQLLDLWLDAGADLGNHSYSHLDINTTALETYEQDIVRGEPMLRAALEAHGRKLRYYRHPFLVTGTTPEAKAHLQTFLDQHGYTVAPVTLDNSDYQYAALYTRAEFRERVKREYVPYMESVIAFFESRSIEVAGREFPQTLLIHANDLNADLMPDLLAMLRRRGYTFVTLDAALADATYRLPETYVGRGGFSWIHRWSRTMTIPPRAEPEPPAWVTENWNKR